MNSHARETRPPVIAPLPRPCDPAALAPEVVHGCVDWFDYQGHPLEHPLRPEPQRTARRVPSPLSQAVARRRTPPG